MSTNYGKIAYHKTEELSKKINFDILPNRIMAFSYKDTLVVYDTKMFSHTLLSNEGVVVSCKIEYECSTLDTDISMKVYVNGVPVYHSSDKIFSFDFISSENTIIEVICSGATETTIANIKFSYTGKFQNNLDADIMYFDENQAAMMYFCNGVLTKYTNISAMIDDYKYITHSKDFLSVSSIVTSIRKSGLYAIYYDDATGYIVMRNLANTTTYNLVQAKPDRAIFFPISSAQYRVVYLLDNKLYFFNTTRYGTNISAIKEIPLDNFKVKDIFSIVQVNNNTVNVQTIGLIGTDGVAYIMRYDTKEGNYTGRKYIGKCDYASGFYDNTSISIVLYQNGVAVTKKFGDRQVTNLVEEKKYYNCYRIYKLSTGVLGLNFDGLSILT